MPYILPPVITATTPEQFVLDGLAINDGIAWELRNEEIDFTPPKLRPEWIGSADSEFQDLVRAPLHENRVIVLPLQTGASARTSKSAAYAQIGALQDKLTKAARTRGGIPMTWTPRDLNLTVTFDVLSGEISELPLDWFQSVKNFARLSITLTCKPYWRGIEVDAGTATSSTPFVTKEVTYLNGEVSALGRLIITDTATQPRRHAEWGLEGPDTYDPATSLMVDSDDVTILGGTQTVTSGGYDPNATGNNSITITPPSTGITALCSLPNLAHVGVFKVRGRFWRNGNFGPQVRLAWQTGSGPLAHNSWVTLPNTAGWSDIDLGTITIPRATSGSQRWTGRIEMQNIDTFVSGVAVFDYLILEPQSDGWGQARAVTSIQSGVTVSFDDLTGTTAGAALNTRTPPLGAGTWATSGAGTDFAFYDTVLAVASEGVSRSTTTDAGAFRFGILGSTVLTDQTVSADVEFTGTIVNAIKQCVIARWTDASNYVRGEVQMNPGGTMTGSIIKRVAGVETTLATLSGIPSGAATVLNVALTVYASGHCSLRGYVPAFGYSITLDGGIDSALATGGALASGKGGIADMGSVDVLIRYYDNVVFAIAPEEPIVIYSSQSIEVRHDGVEREDAAGVYPGPPPSYRGSRFLLPVGTSRVMVKARRNDNEVAADTQVTDATQVQVLYTPRGLTVPR
jgi:hypothetical protein